LEAIPIAVSRGNKFEIAHDFETIGPGDRTLVLVPIAPFRDRQDTLAAAAERLLQSG
jgi:hypothetical protein